MKKTDQKNQKKRNNPNKNQNKSQAKKNQYFKSRGREKVFKELGKAEAGIGHLTLSTHQGQPQMSEQSFPPTSQDKAEFPKRNRQGHLPPGCRIVHVAVTEQIFNQAKANACLSGLRFPHYVACVLRDAGPYQSGSQAVRPCK